MRLTKVHKQAFVKAVMDDLPSIDYNEQAKQLVEEYFAAKCPADIVAFNKKHPGLLNARRVDAPYPLNGVYTPFALEASYNTESAHPALWKKLVLLAEDARAQVEKARSLREKVRGLIEACSTRKQAAERMPEFEKYLPAEETAPLANLPVSNVVAELVSAGWPKGTEPPKTKTKTKKLRSVK